MLQYSTSNFENIKRINDVILESNGRIVSYEAEKIGVGEGAMYRVSIVVRAINSVSEEHIIHFVQKLPDVLLEKFD